MTRINYSKLREEISVFLEDKVQPQWRLPMTQQLMEIVKGCEVKGGLYAEGGPVDPNVRYIVGEK